MLEMFRVWRILELEKFEIEGHNESKVILEDDLLEFVYDLESHLSFLS
jgi:hypothetical protein